MTEIKHTIYESHERDYIGLNGWAERNVTIASDLLKKFTDHVSERTTIEVSPRLLIKRALIQFEMPLFWLLNEPQSFTFWDWMQKKYVPHKIAVFDECVRVAESMMLDASEKSYLLARAVVHDLSKLGNNEVLGHMEFTPGGKATVKAIDHHYRVNDHHPEYWVINGDATEMSKWAVYEMVADWAAASQTYGTPLQEWVDGNFEKKPLHPASRELARTVLERVYKITFKD